MGAKGPKGKIFSGKGVGKESRGYLRLEEKA